MAEPTLHFSVILSVSALRLGVKHALLLPLLALLSDLDILLHIHRSMSCSVILLGLTRIRTIGSLPFQVGISAWLYHAL